MNTILSKTTLTLNVILLIFTVFIACKLSFTQEREPTPPVKVKEYPEITKKIVDGHIYLIVTKGDSVGITHSEDCIQCVKYRNQVLKQYNSIKELIVLAYKLELSNELKNIKR